MKKKKKKKKKRGYLFVFFFLPLFCNLGIRILLRRREDILTVVILLEV